MLTEHADTNDTMVNFDVVSLFTRVPLKEALEHISHLLMLDDNLRDRTNIPADTICELIEMCLRATYFKFEDQFFEQVDSAAMGSPLSPIVANLYMENFERQAPTSAPLPPRLWIRFVDDTFALWPHSAEQLEDFNTHLNEQHPHIQFTREEEANNQTSFLDVMVKREDGSFRTTVYRKPTHTGMYTHFTSHHHPRVKSGTIRCLAKKEQRKYVITPRRKGKCYIFMTLSRGMGTQRK